MFQPPLIHGKTPAKIRENDKERTEVILNAGYRVIEQWECQWNQLKETDPEIKEFVRKLDCLPQKFSTLETFLNAVWKEKVYGIAEIDIHVPDHLKEHFKELPPIFKNTTVERQHLSAEMQDYAKEFGLMKNGWKCLVASYFGEKIMLSTDYIKWCLEHGLVVTKCYQFLCYKKAQPFKDFLDFVTENRRRGDVDKSLSVIAETSKLIGNSAYGIQLINKSKFQNTLFVDERKVDQKINSPKFRSYDIVDEKIYEINMAKRKIVHDEPILVGFTVLNNGKQRMLEFRYDFLGRIMRPRSFRAIEMDTDSFYMALTENDLYECFNEVAKSQMQENAKLYHEQENCYLPNAQLNFLTRSCCKEHGAMDKRTPGLFKIEWKGTEMICLNSKTYCAFDENNRKMKMALKGSNKNLVSPLERFKSVLFNKVPYEGTNKGFRYYRGNVFTYKQNKMSITYFYYKRFVHDDGVTTSPINV